MPSSRDSENIPQIIEHSKKSPTVILVNISSQSPPSNTTLKDLKSTNSSNISTASPSRQRLCVTQAKKNATTPSPSRKALSDTQKEQKRMERERQRLQKEEELRQKKEQQEILQFQRQSRKEEVEREKEARRLQREEEKKAKEDERLKREEEKRLKEKEKEEERLKREEDKRVKEKEKEDERIKREEDRKVKEKEKEEERKKRESERQQKELERQREEEEKQRKAEKQRAILMGFFKKQNEKPQEPVSQSQSPKKGPFMQVELKKDQRTAPTIRVSEKRKNAKIANLNALMSSWRNESNSTNSTSSSLGLRKFGQPNYLHELRTGQIRPLSYPATWPVEMPDVLCLGEGAQMRELQNSASMRYNHGDCGNGGTVWTKAKLFQFVENYRPAYYGTWRRRSFNITGRHPLARDRMQLDYDVDSDDEWEEEEPGESITQSDEEEEEEVGDEDDDEDAKFLVPHGYLSDDEGVDAEDGEELEGANESLEMKKLRQRLSLAEYETAHRRGLQKLKPLLLGPVWSRDPLNGLLQAVGGNGEIVVEGPEENKENVDSGLATPLSTSGKEIATTSTILSQGEHELMRSALNAYRVFLWDSQLPIVPQVQIAPITPSSRTPGRSKKLCFPENAVPHLIHLIHLNTLGKLKLQFEFRVFWEHHTTGQMPKCITFNEYKRQGHTDSHKTSDSPAEHNLRRTSHLMELASLSLPRSRVYTKLGEIAAFSEGHWAVKREVLEEHKDALTELIKKCGSPTAASVPLTDPTFRFPPWTYVTDVNNRPIRPQQAEKQAVTIAVTPTATTIASKITPKPVPKARKRISLITLTTDQNSPTQQSLQKAKVSRLDVDKSLIGRLPLSATTHFPHRQIKPSSASPIVSSVLPSKKSVSNTNKRRTTLDTFFSPHSAKRRKSGDALTACFLTDDKNSDKKDESCIIVLD